MYVCIPPRRCSVPGLVGRVGVDWGGLGRVGVGLFGIPLIPIRPRTRIFVRAGAAFRPTGDLTHGYVRCMFRVGHRFGCQHLAKGLTHMSTIHTPHLSRCYYAAAFSSDRELHYAGHYWAASDEEAARLVRADFQKFHRTPIIPPVTVRPAVRQHNRWY